MRHATVSRGNSPSLVHTFTKGRSRKLEVMRIVSTCLTLESSVLWKPGQDKTLTKGTQKAVRC